MPRSGVLLGAVARWTPDTVCWVLPGHMQGSADERVHLVSSGRRASRQRRVRSGQDAGQGRGARPGGCRPGGPPGGVPRGLRGRLPARVGLRCRHRRPQRGGARGIPALLGRRGRRPGTGGRSAGSYCGGERRVRRHGRHRARRRDPLLHRPLLRRRRRVPGQAPQADADRLRAPGVGVRGRLDAAGVRHAARQAGRGHLLGELHAAAAHGDVREGHRDLLRSDRGRARGLAVDGPSHRPRGALLRAVGQPVRAPQRLPGRPSPRRSTIRTP